MCWCTPNIRTQCCGKPECHPRDKAEHNAENTEIDALRARVAELENYRINSAKFVSDVITENDFYREQLRRIASETHTRLYMQDIAREALNH